jgi:hypothetical protein
MNKEPGALSKSKLQIERERAERRYTEAVERIKPGHGSDEARQELFAAYMDYLEARRTERPGLFARLRRIINESLSSEHASR